MNKLTGKQFVSNGITYSVGELIVGGRSYSCTSEDGSETVTLSSRAINKLLGAGKTDPAPPPSIHPSEPLSEERCLEQCRYLFSLVDVCAQVRVAKELAIEFLDEKVA